MTSMTTRPAAAGADASADSEDASAVRTLVASCLGDANEDEQVKFKILGFLDGLHFGRGGASGAAAAAGVERGGR